MKQPGLFKLFAVLLTASFSISAQNRPPGWEELVALYYKVEVINYCSLASQQVISGFQKRNQSLLNHYTLNSQQINAIRGEAWAAGHAEWDNRGLGGFRGWCKKEGISYRDYFLED